MKEPPPPMRLSDWSQTSRPKPSGTAPPPPAIPEATPAVRRDAHVSTEDVKSATSKVPVTGPIEVRTGFTPPPTVIQGFDVLRLPRGIARRWWLPFFLGALGLVLCLAAGMKFFKVSATVSVRLMARNPQSFAVNTASYVPLRLQGATLLGALGSPQVAREVAEKFSGEIPAKDLHAMVVVEEVRKTDFVDIKVTTPFAAGQTAELATLWAQEALAFTSRIQAEESAEMMAYLKEQVVKSDKELAEIHQKIIAMRDEAGVVDVEREIDAYLKNAGELDMRYETVRVDIEALDSQLISLRREIRKHSSVYEELKAAEVKLSEMSEYYTEQNPVYLEELARVESLRERVKKEVESLEAPISSFTGTYVGNALYLQILELESKRENLVLQRNQLEAMRTEARNKLKRLPQIAMQAGPLIDGAQALQTSRDALIKRMQEVQVFQEVAPGYYRMFKTPTARDVTVGSRRTKLIMAGLAGGFLGMGLGLLLAAGLEFLDRVMRTRGEAEALFSCPCLAHIPARQKNREQSPIRSQQLWAEVMGPLATSSTRAFWCPVSTPAESQFWDTLLAAGSEMDVRILIVLLGSTGPAGFADLPKITLEQLPSPPIEDRVCALFMPSDMTPDTAQALIAAIEPARRRFQEIWILRHGPIREPSASVVRAMPETILLCALGVSDRDFWRTQRTLLPENMLLRGTVTLG